MQITVAQGAAKHQLSVDGEETVRAVKARLEELCSIPSSQQKLLVKGKEAADARRADPEPCTRSLKPYFAPRHLTLARALARSRALAQRPSGTSTEPAHALALTSTVAALGIADGARLMLLKNAQGHKPAPASAAPTLAANNPANNTAAVSDALASSPAAAGPAAGAASAAASASALVVGSGSIELVVTHGKARKLVALTPRARAPTPVPTPTPTLSRRATSCGARRRLL